MDKRLQPLDLGKQQIKPQLSQCLVKLNLLKGDYLELANNNSNLHLVNSNSNQVDYSDSNNNNIRVPCSELSHWEVSNSLHNQDSSQVQLHKVLVADYLVPKLLSSRHPPSLDQELEVVVSH